MRAPPGEVYLQRPGSSIHRTVFQFLITILDVFPPLELYCVPHVNFYSATSCVVPVAKNMAISWDKERLRL